MHAAQVETVISKNNTRKSLNSPSFTGIFPNKMAPYPSPPLVILVRAFLIILIHRIGRHAYKNRLE